MDTLELRRKLVHASGVFIALFLKESYLLFGGWLVPGGILLMAILLGYGVSRLHIRGAQLPVLTRLINSAEREKDKAFPGRGALRFLTGAFLSLIVFRNNPDLVAAAIIVLALGDAASTLVGISFGRHRIFYNKKKSFEGSVAGVAAAFLGVVALTSFSPLTALAAALTGMLVESLPLGIDDNLTVPLAAGFAIWLAIII